MRALLKNLYNCEKCSTFAVAKKNITKYKEEKLCLKT